MSNRDTAHYRARIGKPADEILDYTGTNSAARMAAMVDRFSDPGQAVTLEAFKAALASEDDPAKPVARRLGPSKPNIIGYTAGTAIYELSDQPLLHFAAGPASLTPFQAFTFSERARDAAE